jgi:transcriptional regulator of acetoin/glycerol metabolism
MLAIDGSAIATGVSLRAMSDDVATPDALAEATGAVLAGALAAMQGNVTAAARALGISRATMHRKMRNLGLQARRNR